MQGSGVDLWSSVAGEGGHWHTGDSRTSAVAAFPPSEGLWVAAMKPKTVDEARDYVRDNYSIGPSLNG
jgi:hypothetical protein